ncbi:hypothetical protein [Aquipuribacter sp. SD81]|uniref:hypothetical protein n=1 Tax=Aquipuribacter sp. SD81 TaxID=3127703 RepID=UPI003018ED03
MDDDVCLECGTSTDELIATLDLPGSRILERRWQECRRCGWESLVCDCVRA